MNVLKKGATAKTVAGKEKKVYWRCAVPGCNSTSSVNRHSFPNNVERSEKWAKAINNPSLHGLTCNELRKYKICQLHFPKSSYNSTPIRQTLRQDAIPELMLYISSSATVTTMRVEDKKMQGDCSSENPMLLPSSANIQIIPCKSIGTPDKGIEHNTIGVHAVSESASSAQNAPSSSSDSAWKEAIHSAPRTYKRRVLLGSITRKNKSTPAARRLHRIPSTLLKKQSKHLHTLGTLQGRLGSTKKNMGMVQLKNLDSLSKTQLARLEMQIRNIHKEAKGSENCDPSCRFH